MPASPILGYYDTPGTAVSVAIQNGYAYLADFNMGLQIIDIKNPINPIMIATYNTEGTAYAVALQGDYVYIADYWHGMLMIDSTDPASPTLISSSPAYTAVGITVAGNYAYLARGEYGLEIRNVSRPSTQISVSTLETPGFTASVAVQNGYAYLADGTEGLQIVDVTNVSHPVLVSFLATSDAQYVTLQENYAYIADGKSGVRIVNISDPLHPLLIDTVDTPGVASAVTVSGKTAYVADGSRGLQRIDITDPTHATLAGTIDTPSAASGVAIKGNYAYIADGAGGLQIVQLANNAAPTGQVMIYGNPTVGETLTVSHTLADADGLGVLRYEWQADGISIGKGGTYVLTVEEVGKPITVLAQYTDLAGTLETIQSDPTDFVVSVDIGAMPGVTMTALQFFSTGEDGTEASFTVTLNTKPIRDVSITFASSDTSEGIVDQDIFLFTSETWNTPQTLVIHGVDDYLDDQDIAYQITGVLKTLDVNYSRVAVESLKITNLDDGRDTSLILSGDSGGTPTNDILQGQDGDDRLYGLLLMDDLSGGLGNDRLYGGYDDDRLYGETGNDQLFGEEDDDRLEGGSGNDSLDGGLGIDTMIGGDGNDVYYLGYDAKDVVWDQGISGVDTVIMPYQLSTYTLASGIENASITPGTQASNLTGNLSNNVLTGNAGRNQLTGGVGRDSLFGDIGSDILLGGNGADTLTGGIGKDMLRGGAGSDVYDFNTVNETSPGNTTRDIIADFTIQERDKIDLKDIDANTTVSGNQSFGSFFSTGDTFPGSFANPGDLYFEKSKHLLHGNTDTDSEPDFAIQITGIDNLRITDIIV